MAGTTRAVALAAFIKAMTHANQAEDRGSIKGLHPAVVAEVCGATVDEIRRLWQAFRELGMILGERIANWAKRQIEKKPRSAAAERTAKWRRKKAVDERQLGLGLDTEPVTASVTSHVTEAPIDSIQAVENADVSASSLDLESDEERIPPMPPQGGVVVAALVEPRQVEILLPIKGGRYGKGDRRPRRESAAEFKKRRFVERCREISLERAGLAGGLAGNGEASRHTG
jgi:hypothetical protein